MSVNSSSRPPKPYLGEVEGCEESPVFESQNSQGLVGGRHPSTSFSICKGKDGANGF